MSDLREEIRSYRVMCRCWDKGVRPGFKVVGGSSPYLMYSGKEPQDHFAGCEWAAAVKKIYEEERKDGR